MSLRALLSIVVITIALPSLKAHVVGELLPPRADGSMDIHHINTGEGAAAYFILPDGTTMLIDCGHGYDIKRPPKYKAPRIPDESRLPAKWVARYIEKFRPSADSTLDYLVISHFHSDHMGGIPDLARLMTFRKILDRGWPDYGKPSAFTGELAANYKAALKGQIDRHQTTVERFKPGANDQITLLKDPAKYPSFEIRQLAANAEVWTGQGTEARSRFPATDEPNENACSTAFRLRYGPFDYYTGGDLPGVLNGEISLKTPLLAARATIKAWRDMESPVAWVTGPVDVMMLNHHGGSDTTNEFFLSVLQPRVMLAQTWATPQISPAVLQRLLSENIYPGPRDVFTTNGMWDGRREHLIASLGEAAALSHISALEKLTATQGHLVLRVAPGGKTYQMIVLDDSAETHRIKSIHGPYESR
ncbi:MAG: MBL fold metallo-hydrolase [Verrucomicrobiota bacterium]